MIAPKLRVVAGFMIILALLYIQSQFRITIVVGDSMLPTFRSGDILLVDKQGYVKSEPQRYDIVVAKKRNDLIVKRIVGLPGESIELRNGTLWVNNQRMPLEHRVNPGHLTIGKGSLASQKYALLGDNRAMMENVCVHAVVPCDKIVGKVIRSWRLWPHIQNR